MDWLPYVIGSALSLIGVLIGAAISSVKGEKGEKGDTGPQGLEGPSGQDAR